LRTWRIAFAFSKIAVTFTLVVGPAVLVGFVDIVLLRLNDWDYIERARVSESKLHRFSNSDFYDDDRI
jgi:hypothetical protein